MHTFADKHSSEVYSLPQSYRIPHSVHRLAMGIRDKFSSKLDTTYKPRDVEGVVESHAAPLGVQYDDKSTLVLYRTHSLRRELEQDLMDKYIPFTVLNGFRDPWHSSFGNAVAAFNMLKEGGTINARQQKSLDRYCRVTTITKAMSWDRYLTIPDRFIDYMMRTEGMEATVQLSTIHGSKGMEAEHVVLYTGITQRVQDGMAYDADAEHKVFYVGATRAKHRLDVVAGELNYEIQIPKRKR